jgi:peroxiredoxin
VAETATPIRDRVAEFNEGFTAQIGPRLSDVFATEQADLVAVGAPEEAVSAGDRLPEATLVDSRGESVLLTDALGERGGVVVFYRGSWCPYCNLTLRTYQEQLLPTLRERGLGLVAISPQTPEASDAAVVNGGLEFTVLTDPGNRLVRELGILTEPATAARAAHTELGFDVADSNADATGDIPFPTVLVVDGSGAVTFADVHVDYTTRTEVSDIIAALAEA